MEHCSILAAERGEPMVGTAFEQGGLLLVEQPGAWGRTGLTESDLDPAVAAELQRRADDAGLRLLAIRRPGRSAPTRRAWAVRPPGSPTTRWGSYDDDTDLLDVPLDGSAGEPAGRAAYLVCTHAKRDACCAVFARPVAAELEALRPGQVWGCSHTGGHRFAPVVVAVPEGDPGAVVYGRVSGDAVAQVVAATEAGEVVAHLLRGLTGHPAPVQAALAHALDAHPVVGDWKVAATTPDGADRWRVSLAGPASLDLVVVAETRPEPMVSCGKPEPSDQTHYRVLSA